MKSNFHSRKENRLEAFRSLAEKNEALASASYQAAKNITDFIPLGQPILVGHHSEKRHRRDLERVDSSMRKSIEASNKAEYYKEKADSLGLEWKVGDTVYSDDPEAILKLELTLADLQITANRYKEINAICRSKKLSDEQKKEQLAAKLGIKEEDAHKLLNPVYSFYGQGVPTFTVTNHRANLRRVEKRIEELKAKEAQATKQYAGELALVVDSVEDNRVQIFFHDKPDEETRTKLKKSGFRWAPSLKAWQKHRNNWALSDAKQFAKA